MKFLELVLSRKSVRAYEPRLIDREVLQRCLQAVQRAPSACNSQPWFFIVVDEPQLKEKLGQAAFSGIHSFNSFAKSASVLVVLVREPIKSSARVAGFIRNVQYAVFDLGIACAHFVLAAQEEGLGTCILGWFDEAGVKKALGLSRNKKVEMIISVGYPAVGGTHDSLRKPLDQISQFNR